MSKSRKHVVDQLLHGKESTVNEDERVVRVVESRGRNQLEVSFPNGSTTLCLIPAKFQKKIWIRKGNYLVVEPTKLINTSSKVDSIVTQVLYDEHVRELIKAGQWPDEFRNGKYAVKEARGAAMLLERDSDDEEEDLLLDINPNRIHLELESSEEETESGEE